MLSIAEGDAIAKPAPYLVIDDGEQSDRPEQSL